MQEIAQGVIPVRRALLLFILLLVALPRVVLADVAPLFPVGPTLQPLGETRVRMESEAITIQVHRAGPLAADRMQELQADVHVHFRFVPAADESMEAGFPLQMSLPISGSERLQDFAVLVDGQPLPFTERPVLFEGQSTTWAVWRLDFQQGRPLDLEVRYAIRFSRGKQPVLWLFYILKTGRFWDGPIGRARATIAFDRPLQPEDILLEPFGDALPGTTPGFRHEGGTLTWEWQDLEPDFDLNLAVRDIFWLDLPSEAAALLEQPLTRESLLAASTVVTHMLTVRDRDGGWLEVRGGQSAGEAARPLLDRLLAGFDTLLMANPADGELEQRRQALLTAAGGDERSGNGQGVQPPPTEPPPTEPPPTEPPPTEPPPGEQPVPFAAIRTLFLVLAAAVLLFMGIKWIFLLRKVGKVDGEPRPDPPPAEPGEPG